jgi:hypothetical protein
MKIVRIHDPQKPKYIHACVVETKELLKYPNKFKWKEQLRKYSMVILTHDYIQKNINVLPSDLILYYASDIIYIHPNTYDSIYETYHETLSDINELLRPLGVCT